MGIDRDRTIEAVDSPTKTLTVREWVEMAMEPLLVADGVVPPRPGLRYTCSPGVVRVTLEPRS